MELFHCTSNFGRTNLNNLQHRLQHVRRLETLATRHNDFPFWHAIWRFPTGNVSNLSAILGNACSNERHTLMMISHDTLFKTPSNHFRLSEPSSHFRNNFPKPNQPRQQTPPPRRPIDFWERVQTIERARRSWNRGGCIRNAFKLWFQLMEQNNNFFCQWIFL